MPHVEAGDIVIVFMVKFQVYNGTPSLLTSRLTDIHVYEAQRVPMCRSLRSAGPALKAPSRKTRREPDAKENEYVLWLFDKIDKSVIPDQQHFSDRTRQSLNVKDKFSLLKDVREGQFADLIVQVVKDPYDLGDNMNLWVSDYTENSRFFHKTRGSADWTDGVPIRDGDVYGYTNNRKKRPAPLDDESSSWSGPLGKRSLQLTCWEPHSTFVREHVHKGDWVRLRNVQIRLGHNSINIEGYIREDREYRDRVYVDVLEVVVEDRDKLDPRIKDAIQRKRDYEKEHRQSHKTGDERKAEDVPKKENSKSKRKKKRETQQKALEEETAKKEAALGLTGIVVSEHQDKDIVPLSTILQPVFYKTSMDNQEIKLELPFTCAQYRTNVRVVDFHPVSLKDFAVGRIPTEYDILSDNEDSDSDSASSTSSLPSHHSEGKKHRVWQWRFALKLEEVSATLKTKAPAQIWVVVDNLAAQLLLNLDATNLHSPGSVDELNTLRERLFRLWGNLEERKTRLETKKLQHSRDPLNAPPVGWSDDEDNAAGAPRAYEGGGEDDVPGSQLSNRPFTCCIRQYGVKVKVEEGEEATAGNGKKWKRVFGLFGTKIKNE